MSTELPQKYEPQTLEPAVTQRWPAPHPSAAVVLVRPERGGVRLPGRDRAHVREFVRNHHSDPLAVLKG